MNPFRFLNYHFEPDQLVATFSYQNSDQITFTETITFAKPPTSTPKPDPELLNSALQLAFFLIGTSYYKTQPTVQVSLPLPLDSFQALFFNYVYQEGLSQFAFENHLTRSNLAHFPISSKPTPKNPLPYSGKGILTLQSGGKDSLLTATLLKQHHLPFTSLYITSSDTFPKILQPFKPQIIRRQIDHENLRRATGKNGHVPITYILQSLALIQALINHQNIILTSIGQEGNELHTKIQDLPITHQWSKTWFAEQLFNHYLKTYISPNLTVGSPLRPFSELKIAELFSAYCWKQFGHHFSSCNLANYRQQHTNQSLSWCGHCPKCANSYLLFAPFIPKAELTSIFGGLDLFENPRLFDTFKGLLGIDNHFKPFECIGEISELRSAYHHRLPEYAPFPFTVPATEFNRHQLAPLNPQIKALFPPQFPDSYAKIDLCQN